MSVNSYSKLTLLVGAVLVAAAIYLFFCFRVAQENRFSVIDKAKFRELIYTYASTTNPPKFRRYRFFVGDGGCFFYHEKREGDKVFLTEEDITVSGTRALTDDEWGKFMDFIDCGVVSPRRAEDGDVRTGDAGPWMFVRSDGGNDESQVFSFTEPDYLIDFEQFCEDMKAASDGREERRIKDIQQSY